MIGKRCDVMIITTGLADGWQPSSAVESTCINDDKAEKFNCMCGGKTQSPDGAASA